MSVFIGAISKAKGRIKSIEIYGLKWFQKSYGNTYHRVKVFVNDEEIATSPITYGYGEQYVETAESLLKKNGYLKRKDDRTPLWRYCKERGIKLRYYAYDVKTERELKRF
jgi:hypothetical protein